MNQDIYIADAACSCCLNLSLGTIPDYRTMSVPTHLPRIKDNNTVNTWSVLCTCIHIKTLGERLKSNIRTTLFNIKEVRF